MKIIEKIYTIETRLILSKELETYLNSHVTDYNKLYRKMWHQMSSKDFSVKFPLSSTYITYICKKYNVMARTVKTIFYSIQGRQKALIELKKTEKSNLEQKILKLKSETNALKDKINFLKPKVTSNEAKEKELIKYRHNKKALYQKQQKLNRLHHKLSKLKYTIANKKYSICFGSKKMYKAQYFLKDNGYKTHIKWHNDFIKTRDKNIEYLGAASESYGNQMCQLYYDESTDKFNLHLRKEYKYSNKDSKCINLKDIDFKYLKEELKQICINHRDKTDNRKPLTFRFKRVKNKWYLQVMFSITTVKYVTRNNNGTIGLDFNNGFIEATETNKEGNITHQYHFDLKYHGSGNKAKSEMSETVSQIVNIAIDKGKDIIIENLKFGKKKAQVGKNKKYNEMIHMLDYSRYTSDLENACHRKGVKLVKINPAYTSYIGEKYTSRKLNRHQAASYIIARMGQGFKDSFKGKSTYIK